MSTRRVVYAGRRRGSKVPLLYVYAPEDGGEDFAFSKPLLPGVAVGYVLEVTVPEDAPGSIYTSGQHKPQVVGFAEGESRIPGWQAEDRAAYEVKAGLDAAKRQEVRNRDGMLDYHLGFVALAAKDLSWRDRDALIAYVSSRIRAGL